jgi:hypothetical protein
MTEYLSALRAIGNGSWGKPRGTPPAGWFWRAGRKAVDPLYLWSAALGLLVALVLIALAIIMQMRPLH